MDLTPEEILNEGYYPLANGEIIKFEDYLERSLRDMPFYSENTLWIDSDISGETRLIANPMQVKFDKFCEEMKKTVGFIRAFVLKARRMGFSTWIQGRGFRSVHLMAYQRFATVAHREDSTQELFGMSKLFYDRLFDHPLVKPVLGKANEREMIFKDQHSRLRVHTAGGKEIGRAHGNRFAHISELAFYPDAEKIMKSLKQTIRKLEGTEVYKETTANGVAGAGKFAYDWYKGAYDPRHPEKTTSNDYWRIFFAWFEDPRNTMVFINDLEKEMFMESVESHKVMEDYGDEAGEKKEYKLTWEQLKWRRMTIRNECNSDVETFKQEYPSNDVDCFLSSSNNIFPVKICLRERDRAEKIKPIAIGNLIWRNELKKEVRWVDDKKGFINLWAKPENLSIRNRYCAGVDVSEGMTGSDFSDIVLIDRMSRFKKKTVASWHGLLDPDLLAEEIRKITIFFCSDVFWCIERNNDGKTVISHLTRDKFYKLYRMHNVVEGKGASDKIEEKYGYITSGATKLPLIMYLNTYIRENLIDCPYVKFWDQTLTFVRQPNINPNARTLKVGALNKDQRSSKNRTYDDIVIAKALALECDRVMPPIYEGNASEPEWAKRLKEQYLKPSTYMGV